MSAPSTDFPALGASTSSSGYSDGLGRRALAFDREDGTMLERLVVLELPVLAWQGCRLHACPCGKGSLDLGCVVGLGAP